MGNVTDCRPSQKAAGLTRQYIKHYNNSTYTKMADTKALMNMGSGAKEGI